MHEMSVIWLRVASLLYSVGLLHALLVVLKRSHRLFLAALATFLLGVVLHLVSIIEEAFLVGRFPANNFYESISLCAVLIAITFLLVYWRNRYESLSVFIFPLVFVLTLVGALGTPVAPVETSGFRDALLLIHVGLVLLGYAALLLTAVGAILYLIQERALKAKRRQQFLQKLPPLLVLDDLIWKAMSTGFVFLTLAVVFGSIWAFVETGTRWITDPRIVVSLITWLLYLLMVFLRVSAGWRGRRAAWMVLSVLGLSLITWVAHSGLGAWLKQ